VKPGARKPAGPEDGRALRALGERLREARLERELTLTELARRAGMSRRALTEAEAGRANPTLLKLVGLARALDLAPAELFEPPPGTRRGRRVALLGLRGAGKSSVGRPLALALEAPFVELDRRVEELSGLSLTEVFDLHGEEHFRRLEAEALESVLAQGERVVLATGGSLVAAPRTFARLRRTCRTVWLRARPQEHFQRVLAQGDRRPMRDRPRAMEELRAILAAREPLYARCDLTVDTSRRSVEEVVATVLDSVQESGG